MKVPIQGGTRTTLAAGLNGPTGIAVDSRHVYWVDSLEDAVMRVPTQGGTPTVVASQEDPFDIVVDDENIYWTTSTTVMKMAKP